MELISNTFSSNINSIASKYIQNVGFSKIESKSQQLGLNFQLKQVRRDTAILLTVTVSSDSWSNFGITVLFYNQLTYPNIMTGDVSLSGL